MAARLLLLAHRLGRTLRDLAGATTGGISRKGAKGAKVAHTDEDSLRRTQSYRCPLKDAKGWRDDCI